MKAIGCRRQCVPSRERIWRRRAPIDYRISPAYLEGRGARTTRRRIRHEMPDSDGDRLRTSASDSLMSRWRSGGTWSRTYGSSGQVARRFARNQPAAMAWVPAGPRPGCGEPFPDRLHGPNEVPRTIRPPARRPSVRQRRGRTERPRRWFRTRNPSAPLPVERTLEQRRETTNRLLGFGHMSQGQRTKKAEASGRRFGPILTIVRNA